MSASLEIQLIAVLVAAACTLPGIFLVLRGMAMLSDSITHTILLGIVIAFFFTYDLSSPWLIIGASLMGLLTVWLTELLYKTNLVKEDASIGVIFPFLFSIGVILITKYAGKVHLDTDAILLGELAFAPFDRLIIGGVNWGPKGLYVALSMLLINSFFIFTFFKEFTLCTFDKMLALSLGFSPTFIFYLLTFLTSLTAVGSFQVVGSILVVAFMVGPPISAYLLTHNLKKIVILSLIIAVFNSLLGFHMAMLLDVSIAGMMAFVTGLTFLFIFLFSPSQGIFSTLRKRSFQRQEVAKWTLLFHLKNHTGSSNEEEECSLKTIGNHLQWSILKLDSVIKQLKKDSFIYEEGNLLKLTERGKNFDFISALGKD